MGKLSFEDVVRAARELPDAQKAALMMTLRMEVAPSMRLTREQLVAELAALRAAGAFGERESVSGTFARPGAQYVADEVLFGAIHEAATQYEEDMDELNGAGS
jgi:hypothetical protein